MKKMISLFLVLVLLFVMSVTVFASNIVDTDTGSSQEVHATYKEGLKDKTIISVEINWNKMSFTYHGDSEPQWNALEHRYEGDVIKAGWDNSDATITIKNHSNSLLQAQLTYGKEEAFKDIEMAFTDAAPYIGSAYTSDTEEGTPCEVTIKAIPCGELSEETEDNAKIGTITVKVLSNVNPYAMMDDLSAKVAQHSGVQNPENAARGTVYFVDGTDVSALFTNVETVIGDYAAGEVSAEKNAALNEVLISFYSALDIVQ